MTSHPVCGGVALPSAGSLQVGGFRSLFIRCIKPPRPQRVRLPVFWLGNPSWRRNHGARQASALRLAPGIDRAGEGAGRSPIAVFPFFSLPGELSREKPEEDGSALFFGLRQRRLWRRRRRGPGSWRRGSLSTSSPQRARALSYLGESLLFFPREMRLSRARGLAGSSCCAGGARPPL